MDSPHKSSSCSDDNYCQLKKQITNQDNQIDKKQMEEGSLQSVLITPNLQANRGMQKKTDVITSFSILVNVIFSIASCVLMLCYSFAYYWIYSFNIQLLDNNASGEYVLISTIMISIIVILAFLSIGCTIIIISSWMLTYTRALSWMMVIADVICLSVVLITIGVGVLICNYINVWRLLPTFLPGIIILVLYCLFSFVTLWFGNGRIKWEDKMGREDKI